MLNPVDSASHDRAELLWSLLIVGGVLADAYLGFELDIEFEGVGLKPQAICSTISRPLIAE